MYALCALYRTGRGLPLPATCLPRDLLPAVQSVHARDYYAGAVALLALHMVLRLTRAWRAGGC